MSQCVPSWDDVEEHQTTNTTTTPKLTLGAHSNIAAALDVPMVDYEVAELTWENGQLAMHGLGPPRVPNKPLPPSSSNSPSKYNTTTASAWEKPRACGTLESIVNQATCLYHPTVNKSPFSAASGVGDELLPWTTTSATMTMDALVPCTNTSDDHCTTRPPLVGSSTRVGSCSGAPTSDQADKHGCRAVARRVPAVGTNSEWSGRANHSSASGSASSLFMRGNNNTNNTNSHLVVTMDTGTGMVGPSGREFTSTSLASPGNTSSDVPCTIATATTTADDHDSVCHNKTQKKRGAEEEVQKKKGNGKSSVSTKRSRAAEEGVQKKRSRAAAIHNQSERKRRDKINQRMKTLQKLVPNSSKTDKASMLDEVIEYLKQLQAQVSMISRMNMPQVMLPMAMQQQLQMSLMNPLSMGMGLGMGMGMGLVDVNTIARPNLISPAVFHPSAFLPVTPWDGAADGRPSASGSVVADPLSFLACQSLPTTMEAYSRMAALFYQQMSNQPAPPPPKD